MDGMIFFSGQFTTNKPLDTLHMAYLDKFSKTRRMKRDIPVFKLRNKTRC